MLFYPVAVKKYNSLPSEWLHHVSFLRIDRPKSHLQLTVALILSNSERLLVVLLYLTQKVNGHKLKARLVSSNKFFVGDAVLLIERMERTGRIKSISFDEYQK